MAGTPRPRRTTTWSRFAVTVGRLIAAAMFVVGVVDNVRLVFIAVVVYYGASGEKRAVRAMSGS